MTAAGDKPDFEAEGLLEGLDGEAREARLDLLDHLHAEGVPLADLRRAVAEQRLVLLPVERVIAEDLKYTATEVARNAGVDRDFFLAQRRAAGLPTPAPRERAFSDSDVEAARRLGIALELGFPKDRLLEGARVFGACGRPGGDRVPRARLPRSSSGRATRSGMSRCASRMRRERSIPQTVDLLERLYNLHLREQLRNDVVAETALATGRLEGTREVAVCFADMVDFTSLGEEIAVEDLGAIADSFSALLSEIVEPPVILVKTIGDAAMLVSSEPEPLLDAR